MVAAFDFCAFGKGGAAPSIDTAMHGLVEAAHVDNLHPDSVIALATAVDGEKLTGQCFGDRVAWVPTPDLPPGWNYCLPRLVLRQSCGCLPGAQGETPPGSRHG